MYLKDKSLLFCLIYKYFDTKNIKMFFCEIIFVHEIFHFFFLIITFIIFVFFKLNSYYIFYSYSKIKKLKKIKYLIDKLFENNFLPNKLPKVL